jgi:hypothetical protein
MTRARPSSPPDPLDRLVGRPILLQPLRARMRLGVSAVEATKGVGPRPWFWALMGKMYGRVEQVIAGLNALDEALALAREQGPRTYVAGLYQLQEWGGSRAVEHHARPNHVVTSRLMSPAASGPNPGSSALPCT